MVKLLSHYRKVKLQVSWDFRSRKIFRRGDEAENFSGVI